MLWGTGLPSLGMFLFGDPGLAWFTAVAVVGGLAWEIVNHWWPKGNWMFADVVDFVFFVLGAALADFVMIVYTGGLG